MKSMNYARARRFALGLSQRAVADKARLSVADVGLIESKRLLPTDLQRERIAKALDMPPDLLLEPCNLTVLFPWESNGKADLPQL